MRSDVTFLICSCDHYEDAWHPFFELLHIYGMDRRYPMVLNTETKQYTSDHFDIRVINTPGNFTWSQRLRNVLGQIDTEFVFLLLEDFFLQSPFRFDLFETVVQYMRDHADVGVVHTTPTGKIPVLPEEMFFPRNFPQNNITVTAVLWRREYLLKLLRDHENIWEFEWYCGIRAKRYPEKVMQYNERFPVIFDYRVVISEGYGLTGGKWLPKNKELFEKHGITVNFDRLGWYEPPAQRPAHNRWTPAALLRRVRNRLHYEICKRRSLK